MAKKPRQLPTEKALEHQRHILRDIIATNGGQQAVAEALGVTQAAVSKWVVQGYVPLRRAVELEFAYGVPRTRTAHPTLVQTFATTEFEAA